MRSVLRGLLRYVYRNALPVTVRDAVAVQRELAQRDLAPVVADPPAQRRIVVLAPHMDDEVFGCGGTLSRAAAAGSEVRVVFLTDGARGYDPARVASFTEPQRESFERELVITRKDEARKAGALLGFAEPVFLDAPDGGTAPVADTLQRAVAALRGLAPQLVFLPFLTDPHPDHWLCNRVLWAAWREGSVAPALPCWAYEVWTPLVANTLVDITASMPAKEAAMAAYRSQNEDVDYPRVVAGLNAYRSLAAGLSRGYVEAFFVAPCSDHARLFAKTWPGSPPRRFDTPTLRG